MQSYLLEDVSFPFVNFKETELKKEDKKKHCGAAVLGTQILHCLKNLKVSSELLLASQLLVVLNTAKGSHIPRTSNTREFSCSSPTEASVSFSSE